MSTFGSMMALQPDRSCCHLLARGAPVAPHCHQKRSKYRPFLDFTASHKLGITYRDILNFTPLPATCSQYLATGLPSSSIHHLPLPHMVATNLPMLLLGLECALFPLPPLPNTHLSSTSSNPPSPWNPFLLWSPNPSDFIARNSYHDHS